MTEQYFRAEYEFANEVFGNDTMMELMIFAAENARIHLFDSLDDQQLEHLDIFLAEFLDNLQPDESTGLQKAA